MSRVVAVHGAFNELWGPHEIHARWLPAIRDGLWYAHTRLFEDDLRICFYGDLFRRDPERDDPEMVERSRAGAADMIAALAGDGTDPIETISKAVAGADAQRTLDLIAIMTSQADLNQRIEQRMVDTIHPDTRVLVAHSLGTIVSYSALLEHPEWKIDTFITIGSPLGTSMARSMLPPADADGRHPFPPQIRRWVNVMAIDDHVAAPCDGHFAGSIDDVRIDNGHRGHDPIPYFNSRAVGEAIAQGLAG